MHAFGTVPRYTDISHFRAPYKNSIIYTGVGTVDVYGRGAMGGTVASSSLVAPMVLNSSTSRNVTTPTATAGGAVSSTGVATSRPVVGSTASAGGTTSASGTAGTATWTTALLLSFIKDIGWKFYNQASLVCQSLNAAAQCTAAKIETYRWTMVVNTKTRQAILLPVFATVFAKYGETALRELGGGLQVAAGGSFPRELIQKDISDIIALSKANMTFGRGTRTTSSGGGGTYTTVDGATVAGGGGGSDTSAGGGSTTGGGESTDVFGPPPQPQVQPPMNWEQPSTFSKAAPWLLAAGAVGGIWLLSRKRAA